MARLFRGGATQPFGAEDRRKPIKIYWSRQQRQFKASHTHYRLGLENQVFEAVLMCALARDPAQRYPSARSFLQSLLAYTDYDELQSDLPGLVAQANDPDTGSGIRETVSPERSVAEPDPKLGAKVS